MKHPAQTKSKTDNDAKQQNSPGANAASIAPPSYGMDFLDSQTELPNNLVNQSKFESVSNSGMQIYYKADPSIKHSGISINDTPSLEHEADVMGEKAAQIVPSSKKDEPLLRKFSDGVEQKALSNTELPDNLKSGIERLSGVSMDGVKVHYNSEKPAQLNALAYTQGKDIHLGTGQEKHLPHEAWHVVQQAMNPNFSQDIVQCKIQAQKPLPLTSENKSNKAINNKMPPIVFETFGSNPGQLIDIANQAATSATKTVTVLGVNEPVEKDDVDGLEYSMKKLKVSVQVLQEHLKPTDTDSFVLAPLLWWPTETGGSGGRYTVPYFQVRGYLMDVGNAFAPDKETSIFRWIDKDVRDDSGLTSAKVSENLIAMSQSKTPEILSGRYDWRMDERREEDEYEDLARRALAIMNEAEAEARLAWYSIASNDGKNDVMYGYEGTQGQYLPEPTMYMNKTAHDLIRSKKKFEYWNNPDIQEKSLPDQSRESEKMILSTGKNMKVRYEAENAVTKPLKYEKKGDVDYSPMIHTIADKDFHKLEHSAQKEYLTKGINGMRQSALSSQWSMQGENTEKWKERQNAIKSNTLNRILELIDLTNKGKKTKKQITPVTEQLRASYDRTAPKKATKL